MKNNKFSRRVQQIPKSAIHEMTRLSSTIDDVAFLSWAKPTSDTPLHIKEGAIEAIEKGLVGGYSTSSGLPELRQEIVVAVRRYLIVWYLLFLYSITNHVNKPIPKKI